MSTESDYGELLAAYSAVQRKQKWLGPIKMAMVLVATFAGAGWTARGYLEQLATKESQAILVAGLQKQLDAHDGRLALYNDRITVVEVLCGSNHRGLTVRP